MRVLPLSEELTSWLTGLGLGEYSEVFAENAIDFRALPALTEQDLEHLGLKLGHRRILQQAVAELTRAKPEVLPEQNDDEASLVVALGDAERRQLTVMFCDLVGSTELSQKLDPENLRDVIRAYQDTCRDTLERHDGFIARYMGDGVLAYFGYPVAQEDDAERALRAGLDVVESIREGLSEVAQSNGVDLAVRVGIATGHTVVGDLIGEGASQESLVVGETPNLATRMQELAGPNEVVATPSTRRLAGAVFSYEDLGLQSVKGITEPVRPWRVVGELRIASRFEAAHDKYLTPLIGREEEMSMLLRRWEKAKAGEGQVVLISGEAGIGKSRLVAALFESATPDPRFELKFQCSPNHNDRALHPVIAQLASAAEIGSQEDDQERLEKLRLWLCEWDTDLEQDLPYLAALMSISTTECAPPSEVLPNQQRQRTLAALIKYVNKRCAQRPVLCAFEDVHWIDPTTLEWLDQLVDRAEALSIMLMVTFRPEFTPSWIGAANTRLIAVGRITRMESQAVVTAVSGESTLPQSVVTDIVSKTDGVPLFVEEVTRTVLERRRANRKAEEVGQFEVPSTLHDSLMSRLDRLGASKETAQLGAAIGRDFSYELIATVSNLDGEGLREALTSICDSGLIDCRGAAPDARYTFKHALVQDAAYQSLLKKTRQQYHRRIAMALEKHFPTTKDNEPELLAYHYTESRDHEKAIAYWHAAGKQALGLSANEEAVRHFDRALSLLAAVNDGQSREELECELQLARGAALTGLKGYAHEDVHQAYTRAASLCEPNRRPLQLFTALRGLWNCHNMRLELEDGRALAVRLMSLAEKTQDRLRLLMANRVLGTSYFTNGELRNASRYFEQGVLIHGADIHRSCILEYGEDPGLWCYTYAAWASDWLGNRDRAFGMMAEGLALAEALPSRYTLSYVLANAALFYQYRNDLRRTREYAEQALTVASEQGSAQQLAIAEAHLGWVTAAEGNPNAGIAQIARALDSWRNLGGKSLSPHFLTLLADACMRAGRLEEAVVALDEADDIVTRTSHRSYEVQIHRQRAAVLEAFGDERLDEAEQAYLRAIEVAHWQGTLTLELRSAIGLTRLLQRARKSPDVKKILTPIYEQFTEGHDTSDLIEASELLNLSG